MRILKSNQGIDGRIRCGLSYHREIKSLHPITPPSYPIISCGGSNHAKIRLSYQIMGRRSGRRLSGLDNSKVCEPGILPSPCLDVILLGKMPGYGGLDVGQKKSPAFRWGLFRWFYLSLKGGSFFISAPAWLVAFNQKARKI